MAELAWTVEEFFAWQEKQDDRYEMVDGKPSPMTQGAANIHVAISINVMSFLHTRLRGTKFSVFYNAFIVMTKPGQIRRPDIGVDCGPCSKDSYVAHTPIMLAEVLTPGRRDFETLAKVPEYKLMPGLRYLLLIEPEKPEVAVWHRDDTDIWSYLLVEGLQSNIAMPEIGVTLPMADVYEGITLARELRVVAGA